MRNFQKTYGYQKVIDWMNSNQKKPFDFQLNAWNHYLNGYDGLVNAPTGFGKTYSLLMAVCIEILNEKQNQIHKRGLQLIWLTPLRSLSKDLAKAMEEVIKGLDLDWEVAVRNGDTPIAERQKQTRKMPEILITTPESLHLLLAQKKSSEFFKNLRCVVVDEWHELLGNKRGVMVELALAQIESVLKKSYYSTYKRWAITATIGNLQEALMVLQPDESQKKILIQSKEKKKIEIHPIIPQEIETMPWAGHLGTKLAHLLLPVIEASKSCLIFTNTRNQSEMWYRQLLEIEPNLAGQMALHHGSIDMEIRQWIEDALSKGSLKVVICTSSLDLGVDFKPVDTVVQIGSPKGIARFMQRAGRSGHSPYETSKIYFLPTHALELIEVLALKEAYKRNFVEAREPYILSYDVLLQFMVTLAVGEGFYEDELWKTVKKTHAYSELTKEDWKESLTFVSSGGDTLTEYPDFHKVEREEDGKYKVNNRRTAMRHRLNMGAIVSETMLKVKFMKGGYIGMVEEYFASKLKPNDAFHLGGRTLEFIRIKDLTVYVKNSKKKQALTPSWKGGRLPMSNSLGILLREQITQLNHPKRSEEVKYLKELIEKQKSFSIIPNQDELLIEKIKTRFGYHLFVYPFEGRYVHELMAALVAYRISLIHPISFSIAVNDYGFELLSDQEIIIDDALAYDFLSTENLLEDIEKSLNSTEMARRKFRDIAQISGLVFQNVGKQKASSKNLQASSNLFFNVFLEYEPNHLLVRQAYTEIFHYQLEEERLYNALQRIQNGNIVITEPPYFTPFGFPITIEMIRENISSEELYERIQKMLTEMDKKTAKKNAKRSGTKPKQ